MSTTLHTLIDIFDHEFDVDGEKVCLKKIEIPIIQRDYAQGRKGNEIKRVRERFLGALYNAVMAERITLDFVYGDINAEGTMTPLDGQQRLTTLFLLHWYAAKKDGISIDEYGFLRNFTYETRYSSRDFCSYLITYEPDLSEVLSEQIVDQPWFPLDWKNDPTISSMLVMLDSIAGKFADVENLWGRLKDGCISFYFLPIGDMGLTDELYIKMNSRGKPLTMFEHFKAELEHELSAINKDKAKDIIRKIDIDWTDMLWSYRGDDNVIDDEFLRYYRFICDIICYKNGDSPQGKDFDEFDLLDKYFSKKTENVEDNIDFLVKCFNCWCDIKADENISDFFGRFVSLKNHEQGKVVSYNKVDYFENCLRTYGITYGNDNRLFTLGQTVIMYAFLVYAMNRNAISEDDFRRRIRVVFNLVNNSEDELSDSAARSGGNRIPAVLKQVDSIIINGNIQNNLDVNFNAYQLSEETLKLEWVQNNPDLAESLYVLEDYYLLYGQVGIVGLDHPELFSRFISLFDNCSLDKVDCALMSIGNYIQRDVRKWRFQSGSSGKHDDAWRNLFHKRAATLYENTQKCLHELLSRSETFDDNMLDGIIQEYISDCESKSLYEWRYYYVKYEDFRPHRYGKYWWTDYENQPYRVVALWTPSKASERSFNPFLTSVEKNETRFKTERWRYLIYEKTYLDFENSAYVIRDKETNDEIRRIEINQNEDGIDTEDRIKKFLSMDTQELV